MTHAVIVHLRLTDVFGRESERQAIFELENRLAEALQGPHLGELDGNQFEAGECTLTMYGNDADCMFDAIVPLLMESPLTVGGHVVKRYGDAGDPLVPQMLMPL